jgi:hypothetical protein
MRTFLSCLFLIFITTVAHADSFDLYYQPSTIKLTTSENGVIATPQNFYHGWPNVRAARGEWESFQIVITARKVLLQNVHIEPESFQNPHGAPILKDSWMIFRENYVQIPHPSARNSPPNLWWPDALIPQKLQPNISIEPGKSEVFWLTVCVPQNAEAGHYLGQVQVWANGEKQSVTVPLQVEPFAIPAPTMRANVAVYYDVLRDWYTKNIGKLSDAQFAKLKKEYYDFLLQYHINAYDLPVPWNSSEAAQYINNPKVLSVRLPPLSHKEELETAIDVLKKNHAIAKGYYYWIDEPSPDRYSEIINTEKQLQEINPAIKQCVTISPNKTLDGSVDIWCPNIGDFLGLGHLDFGALAAERQKGRETWWYTMVEPKYPYPTWLVDDDALSVRRYGGLMARHGISGFVYSMAHGWGPDPLNNIASFAGTYGDGTLIYPSELVGGHGPMPSIRLMLLRDAMEDYELMKKYPQWEYVSSENESDLGPISIPKSFYKFYRMYLGFIYKDEYDPEHHPTFEPTYFSKMWDQYYKRIDGTYRESPPIREGTLCPVGDPMPLHYFWRIAIPELQPKDHDGHPYYAGILPHPLEDTRIYPEFPKVSEIMWAEKEYLHVSVIARCNPQMNTDWVALEIASTRELGFPGELIGMDGLYAFLGGSNKGIIRWRFVITQKGNALVEKQTNAGHFRVNNIPWKHELKPEPEYGKFSADKTSYVANFTIPRSLFERNKDFPQLRINVLYHHQKPGLTPTIDRWFPDAGNVFMMPQASIIPLDKLANM